MIPTEIISPQFKQLKASFINWLQTLNYSAATITTRERNIKEFLLYLERSNVSTIEKADSKTVKLYARYLKRRENKLFGSGLMNASINVGLSTVNKFFEYLEQNEITATPSKLQYVEECYKTKSILTLKEINLLYETTFIPPENAPRQKNSLKIKLKQKAVAQRDRAMLSIYYGCGLRKSEGVNLNVNDILIERKRIHVRKGKGSKERSVPVTNNNLSHIVAYLQNGRKQLLSQSESNSESLFINQYGTACSDQALTTRLKRLIKNSGNSIIQDKKPSLHTLRHSIATHLLQQGMEIEMIKKFLGHASLESTQIYTHILNEL